MRKFLLTSALLLVGMMGYGQGNRDLVINEILVDNVDNYEDDYGHRVSWIELHNTGFSKANVASCYLVISSGEQSITYRIPKNDARTEIAPQGYTVFFCEGTGTKGTFHTNFTLDLGTPLLACTAAEGDSIGCCDGPVYPGKVITLALLEANGKDTISKITYNLSDQRPDVSMGLLPDKEGEMVFQLLETTTPYATNDTSDELPNHERFRQTDPIGYGMALMAMTVVLIALFALYICFRTVGKIMNRSKKAPATATAATEESAAKKPAKGVVSGEDIAAIALALRMFEDDLHDHESTILTINRVAKAYSPWSSKLYGLTQTPDHRRR